MELYQFLMKEKCLVVLDDIWTKEALDCLSAGFPESNTHSRILLTTRNKEVALHFDPNCFIHSLRCLNESQSWELFFSVAVRHREEGFTFDENLEEIGRRIVDRCGGLPLAVKTLGGNLRTKSSLHDWTMVYNNMLSHLSGINNGTAELGITTLLALSYHDLPYQLKQCFLHFSQFPEDFIIPARTIIIIWVAEGIIPKGCRSGEEEPVVEVEDIAYAYLDDLVSRCMVQVERWSSTERIKKCRLHDLMRDLCIQEAKKENFFHACQDGNDEPSTSTHSTSTGKLRSLALYMKNSSRDHCLNHDRYARVRSLFLFPVNSNQLLIENSQLVAMARNFKYLRLLNLNGVIGHLEIPEEIGDWVHLRLLEIGSACTKRLPSSLGKLTRLLTMRLGHIDLTGSDSDVLNILKNMHQLRHLYLPDFHQQHFSHDQSIKLSHLRNLQTLVNIPLRYVKIEELVGLPSLRKLKLRISDSYEFKCLVEMLNTSPGKRFNKLQCLSLSFRYWRRDAIEIIQAATSCPRLHKLKLSGPSTLDLQEGSQIFRQLNNLTLKHSSFAEDPIPILGKLPNLRVLHLHSTLDRDSIMFFKNSFQRLHSLVLSHEARLEECVIEEGALPCLSFLQLYYCVNLNTLPEGLKFLYSLQELKIGDMPMAFLERIKKGGEDYHKVQNVPSLLVDINL